MPPATSEGGVHRAVDELETCDIPHHADDAPAAGNERRGYGKNLFPVEARLPCQKLILPESSAF